MPLSLQAKLLRALESRTIQRVGGSKEIEVDFRLVCATHQNIEADIETGKFRADLFYRINVFPLTMPALAARAVDIPILVEAIIKRIKKESKGTNLPNFKDSAMSELMRYPWPGNVRELRNVIERACLLYPDRSVENTDVRNNLLRIKAPDPVEEQEALWKASEDFTTVDREDKNTSVPLPHPSHYEDWFSYFDSIDLRAGRYYQSRKTNLHNGRGAARAQKYFYLLCQRW